jgi:hypothetical protein
MGSSLNSGLGLKQLLESRTGLKLQLKINDNRSTMLSVKWDPDCTKVSLHRMFLKAPKDVMEDLAFYLRRKDKEAASAVNAFIDGMLPGLDYSHQLDRSRLYFQGNVYNLQKIYNRLNTDYFRSQLSLSITWFGKTGQRSRSRVIFGLYHDPLKLIKINRMLDSPSFPDYLVDYIVYHEMVHHVCPSYFDQNGQHHIHTKEFKKRESRFRYFALAQNWIKENQATFFI